MIVLNVKSLMQGMVTCTDEWEETSFHFLRSAWKDMYLIIMQNAHDAHDPDIKCMSAKQILNEFNLDMELLLPMVKKNG